jgi:ribosomal protein L19E
MSAAVATAVKTGSLKLQRRLAMSIFKVGYRKVWLDPKKIPMIAQAKTRA